MDRQESAHRISLRFAQSGTVALPEELQADLENTAQVQLERLLNDGDRRELHAVAVLRTSSTPANSIVDYAKASDINLIVTGTHGRGAFAHMLLGSVADRVVRTFPCPELVVRHAEREAVDPASAGPITKG